MPLVHLVYSAFGVRRFFKISRCGQGTRELEYDWSEDWDYCTNCSCAKLFRTDQSLFGTAGVEESIQDLQDAEQKEKV